MGYGQGFPIAAWTANSRRTMLSNQFSQTLNSCPWDWISVTDS